MLAAATAMAEAGLASKLAVHGLAAEEDGGLGAFGTLVRGHHGAACVIPEPTGGSVITANAGALGFRLTVPGRSAHGSMRYEGVDPLEKFQMVHEALRTLETARNRDADPLLADFPIAYPLSIGIVRAGDWASTIPDSLIAEGRYGVRLDESVGQARAEFEAAVAVVCARDPWLAVNPATVEWWGGQFASGRLPRGHELLGQVQDAVAAVTGVIPPVSGAPYGSDLRHYAAAGIPTLHWGPGLVNQAHTADEWVSIDELHDAARGLTKLALTRCT